LSAIRQTVEAIHEEPSRKGRLFFSTGYTRGAIRRLTLRQFGLRSEIRI